MSNCAAARSRLISRDFDLPLICLQACVLDKDPKFFTFDHNFRVLTPHVFRCRLVKTRQPIRFR